MSVISPPATATAGRQRLTMRGQVQGVGFRPFVYRLARALDLSGWVCNDADGVVIEVQGPESRIREFIARVQAEAPLPARIAGVARCGLPPMASPSPFFIAPSRVGAALPAVAADAAVCAQCLEELFDPADRRYRYPFITCAHCGPRFTLTRTLPFDRRRTSMAAFEPCALCRGEYERPDDRRFHAQTNACPACGPRLSFHDDEGTAVAVADPVAATVAALRAGQIVALKGVGGFHLLCDARNPAAVARLRRRKGREAKPFAVMAANLASLSPWAAVDEVQRRRLESSARPIVLLYKGAACDHALAGVAPRLARVGVMLPYAPLHYLLFHEAAGRPAGTAWLQQAQPLLLVCTSANAGGEPLVIDNAEAFRRLRGIADVFLSHDRDILQRCDDSVIQGGDDTPLFIRRARGFVPRSIQLSRAGPAVLALGGDLKNSFCLTRDGGAYVSQHNGDLDNAVARRALEETLEHWLVTLNALPQYVAHDRHPDFFTTRLAQRFAAERGLPCVAVQHHHAHIAAVVAEQGIDGPVLGLALDGFGLGDDGGLWGGELLRVEGAKYRRLGALLELALPGGERAAREPWRMAASALHALGRGDEIPQRFPHAGAETVAAMLDKKLNAPLTSSAGRWFDAAAGLLGVAVRIGYEGQAAMALEALALRHEPLAPRREDYSIEGDDVLPAGKLNLLPLIHRLARERDAAYGAALFHATLVAALSEWLQRAAQRESLSCVVLNGGCFMNALLRRGLCTALRAAGLNVHLASCVPPNDGGLSLGQAWVAMQQ